MTVNFVRDLTTARGNWSQFLFNGGATLTVKRQEKDADGASTGEGATIVYTAVPFCENLGGGSPSPVNVSGNIQRQDHVYQAYAVSLSFPYGTDIKTGDRLEQEPVGTGLPVWEVTWADTADPMSIDQQVNASVKRVMR